MIKYFYGRYANVNHIIVTDEIQRVTEYPLHLRLYFKNGATLDIDNIDMRTLANDVFQEPGIADSVIVKPHPIKSK